MTLLEKKALSDPPAMERGEKMHHKTPVQIAMLFPFILSILAISVLATPIIHAPGRIAFVSDRDGNLEIYSMNPDGSDQVRLTNNPGVDTYPTWSPDGRTIAFIRQSATGEYSLSVMNSDGSHQRDVTRIPYQATPYPWHEKANLSWSPDGRKIVFAGGSGLEVVTVENGAVSTILESSGFTDIEPAWSPDGSRIIFVSSRDAYMTLHTVRPDGRDLQSLPSSGDRWDMSPDWSPTGEKIVFIVHSEESVPSIYMANTDGTDRQPVLQCNDSTCSSHPNKPRWSPGGYMIAYHMWEFFSGDTQIYIQNLNGVTTPERLTTAGHNFDPSWQSVVPQKHAQFDFDGDGKTDIAIFRPNAQAEWWYKRSSDGQVRAAQFGLSSDVPIPADYSGDGKTEVAVYRPDTGVWYAISDNGVSYFGFGGQPYFPVPADYDGDGIADRAIFDRAFGEWRIFRSLDWDIWFDTFGGGADQPVPADYDGDGLDDVAIVRNNAGNIEWWVHKSTGDYFATVFGASGDVAVPGDYTGDGKVDIAVWRPSTGQWFVLRSEDLSYFAFPWGLNGDKPAPGDYDGDGKTDAAVYRPSTGTWYVNRSSDQGPLIENFGTSADVPVAGVYVR